MKKEKQQIPVKRRCLLNRSLSILLWKRSRDKTGDWGERSKKKLWKKHIKFDESSNEKRKDKKTKKKGRQTWQKLHFALFLLPLWRVRRKRLKKIRKVKRQKRKIKMKETKWEWKQKQKVKKRNYTNLSSSGCLSSHSFPPSSPPSSWEERKQ